MILGFISFTVFLITQSGMMADHHDWMEAFEYAHMMLFFMALTLIFQACTIAFEITRMKKEWTKYDTRSIMSTLDLYRTSGGSWFSTLFPSRAQRMLEYQVWRGFFITRFLCTFHFDFSTYLRGSVDYFIAEFIEIEPSVWLLLNAFIWFSFVILRYALKVENSWFSEWYFIAYGFVTLGLNILLFFESRAAVTRLLRRAGVAIMDFESFETVLKGLGDMVCSLL